MAAKGIKAATWTYLIAVGVALQASITWAQDKAAARCGNANWVCVAECIDVRCIDQCLAKGCETQLKKLRRCTKEKGCAGTDPTCAQTQCGAACRAAFEPRSVAAKKEVRTPCAAAQGGARVPERLVGGWNLQAASLGTRDQGFGALTTPLPRPDYEKVLRIEPSGCFVMETKLEDATLGQGNLLIVRSWGQLEVSTDRRDDDKHTVRFRTEAGQTVGQVCGNDRVIDLPAAAFKKPGYRAELEADRLTLVELSADGQTFQFRKGEPETLDERGE